MFPWQQNITVFQITISHRRHHQCYQEAETHTSVEKYIYTSISGDSSWISPGLSWYTQGCSLFKHKNKQRKGDYNGSNGDYNKCDDHKHTDYLFSIDFRYSGDGFPFLATWYATKITWANMSINNTACAPVRRISQRENKDFLTE